MRQFEETIQLCEVLASEKVKASSSRPSIVPWLHVSNLSWRQHVVSAAGLGAAASNAVTVC